MNEGLIGLFGAAGRGGIKSIQRGEVAPFITQNSATQTIAKVNTAKSVLLITGFQAAVGSTAAELTLKPVIVDSETIRFDGGFVPSNPRGVSWVLIEYA